MAENEIGVTGQGQGNIQNVAHPIVDREFVKVSADYLPSPKKFHHTFNDETVVETVRVDAMTFFGVKDFQDRNIHKFFLEFEGRVLENTSQTLEQLLGEHRKSAHFNLIE